MPHGPRVVTQHTLPVPRFGQNCSLHVGPIPPTPPTEASGPEPPVPPNPVPPDPVPAAPEVPALPALPVAPAFPDAPPVPEPPAPTAAPLPESFLPPPGAVSWTSPEQAAVNPPAASSTVHSNRAANL